MKFHKGDIAIKRAVKAGEAIIAYTDRNKTISVWK